MKRSNEEFPLLTEVLRKREQGELEMKFSARESRFDGQQRVHVISGGRRHSERAFVLPLLLIKFLRMEPLTRVYDRELWEVSRDSNDDTV